MGASGEAAEGALVPNAPELKHRKVGGGRGAVAARCKAPYPPSNART